MQKLQNKLGKRDCEGEALRNENATLCNELVSLRQHLSGCEREIGSLQDSLSRTELQLEGSLRCAHVLVRVHVHSRLHMPCVALAQLRTSTLSRLS